MREDVEEELMRMFPNGYVITYIQPNNDPVYAWWNPKDDEFIDNFLYMMDSLLNEEEYDN